MSTSSESGSFQDVGSRSGTGWLAAVIGLWVLVTPLFWGATGGGGWWGGGGAWLYWSNIISGTAIAILAGYSVAADNAPAGWLAALGGLWVLITPFFWGATVGGGINWWAAQGLWLYWSNIVSGIAIAGLAGYSALQITSETGETAASS